MLALWTTEASAAEQKKLILSNPPCASHTIVKNLREFKDAQESRTQENKVRRRRAST